MKSEATAKVLQDEADSRGAHTDTTAARDADERFLADLEATCAQRAPDFEDCQQLRAFDASIVQLTEEISELTNAVAASDKAVAGATAAREEEMAGQTEIFDSAYTGMQDNAGGVVGMIEVIPSDFVRLEPSGSLLP